LEEAGQPKYGSLDSRHVLQEAQAINPKIKISFHGSTCRGNTNKFIGKIASFHPIGMLNPNSNRAGRRLPSGFGINLWKVNLTKKPSKKNGTSLPFPENRSVTMIEPLMGCIVPFRLLPTSY